MGKKWERFTKEELEQLVKESTSLNELGKKCGYSDGNGIKPMKDMIKTYNFDTSHFLVCNSKDLTNQRFGKLIVLERTKKRYVYYLEMSM